MNGADFVARISRPEDCVLGFGIPTSPAGFWERRLQPGEGSFVRRFDSYARYHRQILAPYERLAPRFRRLGVRVVPDLTLAGFSSLFHDGEAHAVILVSHWGPSFLEFRDGPADCEAVVRAVPAGFRGVIDLCVCHPQALVQRLRAHLLRGEGGHVHYIDTEATPILWLHFFKDLFLLLREGKRSYVDASLELTTAYFRNLVEVSHE